MYSLRYRRSIFDEYRIPLFLASFALIAVLLVAGVYFTHRSEYTGYVDKFDWFREWDVEQYMMIGGKCWHRGCEPDRAYAMSEHWEVESTSRRKTGETCTKDSDGNKSCTSNYTTDYHYAWRIYYTVNDWRVGRTMKSNGVGNNADDYYWPELNTRYCNDFVYGVGSDDPALGCEREGQQRQWYYVWINSDNDALNYAHCELPFAQWTDTEMETRIRGTYWTFQNYIDCNDIKWSLNNA